jgi:hypothetical protein
MNVDHIFATLNRCQVAWILIGGMNFLLRHKPILTYDVDIWIEDRPTNLARCEAALAQLDAEWGRSDDDWRPVAEHPASWLQWQMLFCLLSPHGAIDVFRRVPGLDEWRTAYSAARRERTAGNVDYVGLSDEDMLKCQYALEERLQKQDRIATLEQAIREASNNVG